MNPSLLRMGWMAALAACVLGGAIQACNSHAASAAREVTYGRDFKYYEDREVDNSMVRLAADVRRLHVILQKADAPTAEERVQVVMLLKDMEQAGASLKTGRQTSNHPRLHAHAGEFVDQVATARTAVERDPPNYYLAGSITGACFVCHQPQAP